MSWRKIEADRRSAAKNDVTMCVSAGEGVRRRCVTITFRDTDLLALPWFQVGQKVDLLIGDGEHKGRVRIQPGGNAELTRVAGRQVNGQVSVRSAALVSALPLRPGKISPEVVGYDFGDDWVEIDLPAWACAASPLPAPSVAQLTGKQPSAPFRGIASREGIGVSRGAGSRIP